MAKFKHVGSVPVRTPEGRYIGRRSDMSVVPGTIFEADWPEATEKFLLKIGAIEKIDEPEPAEEV